MSDSRKRKDDQACGAPCLLAIFKPLYNEGMSLVEQAAEYLDGQGRAEAKKLSRLAATLYAAEIDAADHAAHAGRLLAAAAAGRQFRRDDARPGRVGEIQGAAGHRFGAATRPTAGTSCRTTSVDLVDRSLSLQELVRRMDEEIYGGNASAPVEPRRRRNPVSDQITLLNTAFGARLERILFLFCSHIRWHQPLPGIECATSAAIRIIGIDPGLRRTGWGIVETLGNALRFVAAGHGEVATRRPRWPPALPTA